MQIKTTMRYHFTHVRMAIAKKKKYWQACGKKETSGHCWWEGKLVQLVCWMVQRVLKNWKKHNYHITSNSTSAKYPVKENEKLTRKDKCTLMFTAALFNNRQDTGQLKQPSTDERIKMWYTHIHTHIRILFSQKERNLAFATKWMDLEDIMLSEISQTNPAYMWNLKHKTNEQT